MSSRHGSCARQRQTHVLCPAGVTRGALLVAMCLGGASGAARSQEQPAAPTTPPTFQPGEISIGEPVTLPFGGVGPSSEPRATGGSGVTTAEPAAIGVRQLDEATAKLGRSGWLGMVVAESNVPGRWRVDEVAPGGPADLAGIRVGDELRAVNGVAPRNADEVAQALTAIVADQPVAVAIARADEVSDITVRAAPRPSTPPAPRGATAPAAARDDGATAVGGLPGDPRSIGGPDAAGPAALPSTPPAFTAPSVMTPAPAAAAGIAEAAATAPPNPNGSLVPPTVGLPGPGVSTPVQPPDVSVSVPGGPTPVGESASPGRFMPATPQVRPDATIASPSPRTPAGFEAPSGLPTGFGPSSIGGASPRIPREAVGRSSTPGGRTALGVRTIPLDPVTQARFQLSAPDGAYVIGVVQDLPAFRAGVPPGSVIVALDERPVHSPTELTSLVTSGPIDRPVRVRYVLPGGTARNADVVLQAIDPPLLRALGGDAADSPAPVPQPRLARRPVEEAVVTLRREIVLLRESLRDLEQQLDGLVDQSSRGRSR